MKHSTLTCVEQHLSFKVLTVYRHLKAGSIQACWQNGHELGTFGGKKQQNSSFIYVWRPFGTAVYWGWLLFFLTLRHSFGSSSGCLLGISTLTSSGCYRLLYHARIKKCPRSSLACTCDDATSPELLSGLWETSLTEIISRCCRCAQVIGRPFYLSHDKTVWPHRLRVVP